ncbi:hypothetical protein ACC691_36385, partial [Rhizobium johnstonii]|uniref:hypothetical protein n=1 Tax=Rhizobium johnstonii TaxID=3019933 RepID=UPI003F98D64A
MPASFDWQTWWGFAIAVVAAAIAAFALAAIGRVIVTTVGRRREWPTLLIRRVRWPFRLTLF